MNPGLKDLLNRRPHRLLRATAYSHRLRFNTKRPTAEEREQLHRQMVGQAVLKRAYRRLTAAEKQALIVLQAAGGRLALDSFQSHFGEIRPYRPWREDCSAQQCGGAMGGQPPSRPGSPPTTGGSSPARVEGLNAELRHYLARLARQSRAFSKSLTAFQEAITLFVYLWNTRQAWKDRYPRYHYRLADFV